MVSLLMKTLMIVIATSYICSAIIPRSTKRKATVSEAKWIQFKKFIKKNGIKCFANVGTEISNKVKVSCLVECLKEDQKIQNFELCILLCNQK